MLLILILVAAAALAIFVNSARLFCPACNDPTFHQCSPTRIKPPQETRLQKYLRQEMEIFQEVCADARAAITQAARDAVHFLARWVILPLSVASMFWIPIANPAALPL
jgi:hypothetical protein